MSYVVLARKWRPMRFEDLVGQDHVARTLGNAIDAGRVAHAFLFTGVRGVGKTTSARILAKALNCMRKPGSLPDGAVDPGPTVTPCLECPACLEITEGTDLDVREIDGASHNGVEEVRKLQDSLPYRPSRDRYKIVIVDEVHMLSVSAWNAFLKTLEEPPPHVKFIFATTEAHKVPITILSRVQRFDFKMIPTRLIFDRLRWVLEQEGSKADDAAVSIIARQAAGSMRDAMSLLDQVIAFGGDELHGDEVARVLGVASRAALLDIGKALVEGRAEECLSLLGGLADQGFDISHVTRDLLALLRDLVVARVCSSPDALLDAADEEKAEIIATAQSVSEQDLLRLHHAFSAGFDAVVRGADPRSSLEMLLARLALRPALLPLDELLKRVANLERRLGGGAPGGSGGSAAPSRGRTQSAATPPRSSNLSPTSTLEPQSAKMPVSPNQHEPEEAAPPEGPPFSAEQVPSPVPHGPAVISKRVQVAEVPPVIDALVPLPPSAPPLPAQDDDAPSAESTPLATMSDDKPGSIAEAKHAYEDGEAQRLEMMAKIGDRIRLSHDDWSAYFEQTVPLIADGTTLCLGLEKGHLFEKQLLSEEGRKIFEQAVRAEWGQNAILELVPRSEKATPPSTLAAERARVRARAHHEAIEQVKNHPRIREALEIFNGQVKNVTLPSSPR